MLSRTLAGELSVLLTIFLTIQFLTQDIEKRLIGGLHQKALPTSTRYIQPRRRVPALRQLWPSTVRNASSSLHVCLTRELAGQKE